MNPFSQYKHSVDDQSHSKNQEHKTKQFGRMTFNSISIKDGAFFPWLLPWRDIKSNENTKDSFSIM